jgi:hypothetical protein
MYWGVPIRHKGFKALWHEGFKAPIMGRAWDGLVLKLPSWEGLGVGLKSPKPEVGR